MTDKWHGGKGDKARKMDNKKYAENWEAIFRRQPQQQQDIGDDGVKNSQAKEKTHNQ
jgi:hypothetical protein